MTHNELDFLMGKWLEKWFQDIAQNLEVHIIDGKTLPMEMDRARRHAYRLVRNLLEFDIPKMYEARQQLISIIENGSVTLNYFSLYGVGDDQRRTTRNYDKI